MKLIKYVYGSKCGNNVKCEHRTLIFSLFLFGREAKSAKLELITVFKNKQNLFARTVF